MKPYSFAFLPFAALTTLPIAVSAQVPANTRLPEMHQVRLQVKFVEASAGKVNAWSESHGLKKNAAEELLASLTKGGAKMTEVVLQAPMIQDAPVSTEQVDLVPFVTTNNGTPQTNYLPVTNSLDVTPHFNTDGTIWLNLTIQRSEVPPSATPQDGPPSVTSQSISMVRMFASGKTFVLSGFVRGAKPGTDEHATLVGGTEGLVFVTATILPDAAPSPDTRSIP